MFVAGVTDAASNQLVPSADSYAVGDLSGSTWLVASRLVSWLPLWIGGLVIATVWMARTDHVPLPPLRITLMLLAVLGVAIAAVGVAGALEPITQGAQFVLSNAPNTIRASQALEVVVGVGAAVVALGVGRQLKTPVE
jgi:hypothetical protein